MFRVDTGLIIAVMKYVRLSRITYFKSSSDSMSSNISTFYGELTIPISCHRPLPLPTFSLITTVDFIPESLFHTHVITSNNLYRMS